MPNDEQLDLLAFAGFDSAEAPYAAKPPRARKPKPPSPAERAASGRLEGARRSRLAPRERVGLPRRFEPGKVVGFPLSANRKLLSEMIERLPHGYDEALDTRCDRETRNLENRLIRRGLPKHTARECATELLHHAYMKRVIEAHKEAGVL